MNRGCVARRGRAGPGPRRIILWTQGAASAYIGTGQRVAERRPLGRRVWDPAAPDEKPQGCRNMDIVTRLHLHFKARLVGSDSFGNRYYEERKARPGKPARRYVRYNGMVEASKVPADWHGWLHHTEDSPPPAGGYARHDWQLDHQPNTTGTTLAHRPAGHMLKGGKRAPATGDYEPWSPS